MARSASGGEPELGSACVGDDEVVADRASTFSSLSIKPLDSVSIWPDGSVASLVGAT